MFWKTRVPISEEMYETGKPGMRICRIAGLCPLSVFKSKSQLYIKWSPTRAVYSFIVGIILVGWSYQGLLEDMWDKKTSIRINTHEEMYVMFCDISVVQLIVIFGIFVQSFESSHLFEFLRRLNEADTVIPPTDTNSAKNQSMCMIIAMMATTFFMLVADSLTYINAADDVAVKNAVVKRYLPFYFTYMIMIIYQYQFWHYGHSILRRLQQLNKCLKTCNTSSRSTEEANVAPILETISTIKWENKNIGYIIDSLNKKHQNILQVKSKMSDKELDQRLPSINPSILKLASAFLHLSEAVGSLNQLLGVTHAVTIIGILWHLIESPFHLLSELGGTRRDLSYMLMNGMWCFYHITRLLIFVEPCNSCKVEVEKIQTYVCNLMCTTTINDQFRFELETFSVVLIQGKLEFSAAGLTTIDRSLVTALLGTITTYLVILLQFQNN